MHFNITDMIAQNVDQDAIVVVILKIIVRTRKLYAKVKWTKVINFFFI